MSFITYAQNGEDVLLWRALGHVPNGFYVDVGANDPTEHSVTRAFYEAGWRGINIEPLPSFHQRFEHDRPGDINLAIAAGATDGELKLYDVPSVNGWASPDAGVAAAHRSEGFDVVELTVPVRTLNGVWAEHVRGDVHFLKIDVEGFEGEVLRGFDLARYRPWILVIEATLPNSRVTNHESWEPLVTSHDYRFAWFDGLNRYYVAAEHAELMAALTVQPNVFDDYKPYHFSHLETVAAAANAAADSARQAHDNAVAQAQDARDENALLVARLLEAQSAVNASERIMAEQCAYAEKLERDLAQAQEWGQNLDRKLEGILNSASWRITEPLRAANGGELGVWMRRRMMWRVRQFVSWLVSRESLRRAILPRLMKFPWLARKVTSMLATIKRPPAAEAAQARVAVIEPHLRDLPASARRAFADLTQHPPTPES